MAEAQVKMDQEPPTIDLPPLKGFQRWLWAQRHDYARLEREYSVFKVELDFLQKRNGQSGEPWAVAANSQLENLKNYLLKKKGVEAGWICLHAARRHAVHGMNRNELQIEASVLRAEATKFTSWRARQMEKLLSVNEDQLRDGGLIEAAKDVAPRTGEMDKSPSGEENQVGSENDAVLTALVIRSMELRDEYFSNQYAKIWLMGSQLFALLMTCGIGLVLLVPFLFASSQNQERTLAPWAYQVVAAVLFFGLLGAAISAAGSLMKDRTSGIPERVGNQFVTHARAWFGAGVGLAGYAFYQSKLLNINFGSDHSVSGAFAVAFLFGFGGELLIVRVLGSVGTEK
jgi:hypothetical protein